MDKIVLRPAYAADCEECGREFFVRAILPEMSEEDEQHLREEYGVETYEEGEFITYPSEVECPHCGAKYETKHVYDDEVEDGS
jgi:hypothetical protein